MAKKKSVTTDSKTWSKAKRATAKKTSKKTTKKKSPGAKNTATKKKSPAKRPLVEPAVSRPAAFPVVGIGASAGGLEALQEFFDMMPKDSGMGFVVVTHQHPGHTSLLAELLAGHTEMPCVEATDATKIEPNHVYVGPPGGNLAVMNGTLHLLDDGGVIREGEAPAEPRTARKKTARREPRSPETAPHLPIDRFLRSLAEDQGERAICVILSGTGTDGTLGLRAIKAASGMAMVEEPASAKYGGMPSSAIATGLADFVLPPREMPQQLVAFGKTPFLALQRAAIELPPKPLQKIFLLLRNRTGHDFSSYKTTTIRRRIERRMGVHLIKGPATYVKYLQQNPHEIDILFKELLISVTSFFRDEEGWAALGETMLPELIKSRPDTYNFRAWVPGCATGEEAFTLAILLRETTQRLGKHFDYQIFGTDLDAAAIDTARNGVYPDGIAVDVAKPRLERYFQREDSTFRVRKEIREMCVFAPQNVIKDPPFTKLDLICCRNLLIYLNADLQQRLLPIFHYALKPGGILMLGPSETVGTQSDLFTMVEKKWKIYTRNDQLVAMRLPEIPAQHAPVQEGKSVAPVAEVAAAKGSDIGRLVDRLLLARHAPASVVVNQRGDIIYIHGRTGLYLEPASGQPKMNVIEMAREGLEFELSSCLRQASTQDAPVERKGVRVRANGGYIFADIILSRIAESEMLRGLYLITLQPAAPPFHETEPTALAAGPSEPGPGAGPDAVTDGDPDPDAGPTLARSAHRKDQKAAPVAQLERELQYTRESLQTTVEELETSNEELKSTNEELQSTNEELQSSNEELETSKEEMHSLNEELNTVNSEMQGKLVELSRVNDDLHNLLNSSEIATIFLDMDLRIKRFTDSAAKLIRIKPADVGRNIGDLKTNLRYDALEEDAREVLRTLVWNEAEIESPDGLQFLLRIMPYRTVDNMIDGLVITFVDTTQLAEARALFESIVETVREPLVLLDENLCIVQCNSSFWSAFELRESQVVGERIYDASGGAWDNADLRRLLEELLPQNTTIEDFELTHTFPRIGEKRLLLNARRLHRAPELPAMILLAMEDVESPFAPRK